MSWEHILKMGEEYRPREMKLRELIPKIAAARGQEVLLAPLRKEMAGVLEEMESAVRPENTLLIREMANKLQKIVDEEVSPDTTAAVTRP